MSSNEVELLNDVLDVPAVLKRNGGARLSGFGRVIPSWNDWALLFAKLGRRNAGRRRLHKERTVNTFPHITTRHFECLLGMRASWSWHRGFLQRTRGSRRHRRANWGRQRRRRVNLDLPGHNECTLVRQRAHFHGVRRGLSRGRLHWRRGHHIIYTISAKGPSPFIYFANDYIPRRLARLSMFAENKDRRGVTTCGLIIELA